MGDNKRLLHFHEQKLSDLEAFKSDTQVFQKNTSASLKNLETQVGSWPLVCQIRARVHSLVTPRRIQRTACHAPNPGPTRLVDPNRFPGRETQDWDSLPDFF